MIPDYDAAIANDWLSDAEVEQIADSITPEGIADDVTRYASIPSRHIDHPANADAVRMLLDDLRAISVRRTKLKVKARGFRVRQERFHNVEGTLAGGLPGVVLVAAHLDCTAGGEPAYQPRTDEAPGADDDASGIAGVLAAARALVALADGNQKHREIRFVLFNAEEARQKGSRQYAKRACNQGEELVAVFQMDMIGFTPDAGRPRFEIHAGFQENCAGVGSPPEEVESPPEDVESPPEKCPPGDVQERSLDLAYLIAAIARDVFSRLDDAEIFPAFGKPDPAQNFSDHTSFHRKGFTACLISENFFGFPETPEDSHGREPNPDYHLREDRAENLNFEYAADIARTVAAAAWYVATRDWPPSSPP